MDGLALFGYLQEKYLDTHTYTPTHTHTHTHIHIDMAIYVSQQRLNIVS